MTQGMIFLEEKQISPCHFLQGDDSSRVASLCTYFVLDWSLSGVETWG